MKQSSFRESFITAEEVRSDEKSFGVIFSVFFFLISIYLWMRDSAYINISAGLTIFFLLSAFTVPKILRPLNIGWFYFGKFLHLVISPIIMSIIFFLIMTPLGLVMRILHKSDPLALNYHELPTYWIDREIQPDSGSFENQF